MALMLVTRMTAAERDLRKPLQTTGLFPSAFPNSSPLQGCSSLVIRRTASSARPCSTVLERVKLILCVAGTPRHRAGMCVPIAAEPAEQLSCEWWTATRTVHSAREHFLVVRSTRRYEVPGLVEGARLPGHE